ncbi:hypothetical protein F511_31777 [Dorcoceras hygrometricum]|uniref:Uncharacterized protein n=1 Tax=Dorcoceras hygrometricum TaxID=472368 RepID=A0A2Z7AWN0_9LAMI|nr:hypothetical protein F511_31777 [Dorcoceras hygrometricum]
MVASRGQFVARLIAHRGRDVLACRASRLDTGRSPPRMMADRISPLVVRCYAVSRLDLDHWPRDVAPPIVRWPCDWRDGGRPVIRRWRMDVAAGYVHGGLLVAARWHEIAPHEFSLVAGAIGAMVSYLLFAAGGWTSLLAARMVVCWSPHDGARLRHACRGPCAALPRTNFVVTAAAPAKLRRCRDG